MIIRLGLFGYIGLLTVFVFFTCSIKPPEVRLTGDVTALEQEVLGTYSQVEEDTWMIASTRGSQGTVTVKTSPEKDQVLEAMRTQKYNKDDVDEFKQKGYVGENNRGFLEIRDPENLEDQREVYSFVQTIVTEENRSREVIMNRVIEVNTSLREKNREDILSVFAKMYQENSLDGTWIQNQNGKWIKK